MRHDGVTGRIDVVRGATFLGDRRGGGLTIGDEMRICECLHFSHIYSCERIMEKI